MSGGCSILCCMRPQRQSSFLVCFLFCLCIQSVSQASFSSSVKYVSSVFFSPLIHNVCSSHIWLSALSAATCSQCMSFSSMLSSAESFRRWCCLRFQSCSESTVSHHPDLELVSQPRQNRVLSLH